MISLRPSLITEHHSVWSLNDLAPNPAPRTAQVGLGMANDRLAPASLFLFLVLRWHREGAKFERRQTGRR